MSLSDIAKDALAKCKSRGWSRSWLHAGCYLHLEVSEFLESIRGKSGVPEQEAADILFVLLSTMEENSVDINATIKCLNKLKEDNADE